MIEKITKEKITELMQQIKDSEIRLRLIEKGKKNFIYNFEVTGMNVKKLQIEENIRTPFKGIKIILNKPITIIYGNTSTGKTTVFDKVFHLLSNYHSKKSPIKNWKTELALAYEDTKSKRIYQIIFNSEPEKDGKRIIVEEFDGILKKVEIEDPPHFLIDRLVLDYPFNYALFITEDYRDSYVYNSCRNEELFKKQFRSISLKNTFDDIRKEIVDKKREEENYDHTILGLKESIEKCQKQIEIINKKLNDQTFLISNEKKLKDARVHYDKILDGEKKSEQDLKKKISSNLKRIREIRKKIDEIKPLIDSNAKSKWDMLVQKRVYTCIDCGVPLSNDFLKARMENGLCWKCGFGQYSYNDMLSTLPVSPDEKLTKKRIESLESQIKKLEEERDGFNKELKDKMLINKDHTREIWENIKIYDTYSDLEEEINIAKREFPENEIKVKSYKEEIAKFENKAKKYSSLSNDVGDTIKELMELEKSLLKLEETEYLKLKGYILKEVNQALMSISENDKIGQVLFDLEGRLVFRPSFKESKESEDISVDELLSENKPRCSSGTLEYINLAFLLAILKLEKERKIFSVKLVLLDGLKILDKRRKVDLLKSLHAGLPEFKIIMFDNEDFENLKEDLIQCVKMEHYGLMVKHKSLENIRQTTLDTFFI